MIIFFSKDYSSDELYASPTERSAPVWKRPPMKSSVAPKKLQVITRSKNVLDQGKRSLHAQASEIIRDNQRHIKSNFGKRSSVGGYNVHVYDGRNRGNSYSIEDGFVDTKKFPARLINNNNTRNNIFRQKHTRNGDVSDRNNLETVSRHLYVGNGNAKSSSGTVSSTRQFNQHLKQINSKRQNNHLNRRRFRG